MSQRTLEEFWAYRKVAERFDLVVADMTVVKCDPRCFKLYPSRVVALIPSAPALKKVMEA